MTTVPALTDEAALNQYVATGGQTDFNFSFMIFATADIDVYVNGVLKTEVTDYTVRKSGGGSISSSDLPLDGGKVVFVSGLTADDEVTLNRNIAIARSTGYSVAGAFRADVVNGEFTKQLAISQQLRRDIERSLRLEAFDSEGGSLIIPTGRTSKLVGFDADGNVALFAGVAEQEVPVSSFMATVLDDADAAAARATLGLTIGTNIQGFDADLASIASLIVSRGALIIGNSTPAWSKLSIGSDNQYLRSDGTDISWVTPTAPTIQKFTSGSGTYTTPAGVKFIRVRAVGAGGGGAGSATTAANNHGSGTAGGDTTFGTSLLTASGGAGGGGTGSGAGGAGGSATINSPAIGTALSGGTGGSGGTTVAGQGQFGAAGASSFFGGASGRSDIASRTNTGSGGAAATANASSYMGGAGGAGGFIEAIIVSPGATYAYAVGAAGAGGTAGTGGNAGGAGGSGYIEVTEFYH